MSNATIAVGDTEAETLDLGGTYAIETLSSASGGAGIKATGTGTATGTFTGASGTYWLDVSWINEHDGISQFAALINGVEVGTWNGTGGSNTTVVERIAVTLEAGDEISLEGVRNSGEFARIDEISISDREGGDSGGGSTGGGTTPTGATIAVGDTEAETLDLGGTYAIETLSSASGGAGIKATGTGTATGTFTGASGTYWLDVSWINEHDGISQFAALINGVEVGTWNGTGGSNTTVVERIAVTLEAGDEISLEGVRNSGEFARIDEISISDREGGDSGGGSTGGGTTPTGATIAVGDTEAETLDLGGTYAIETLSSASGGAGIKATGTGTATGTFTGASGTYWLDVSWINEHDGISQFAALINGVEVGTWNGTGGSNTTVVERIAVTLEAGDEISLEGVRNSGEFARIDEISISDREGGDSGGGSTGGGTTPTGATIAVGDTEAETLDLGGTYAIETLSSASGGAGIKATGTGTATGTFTGASGTYWLDVSWINEHDGISQFAALINGVEVGTWNGTGGSNTTVVERIAVTLEAGDEISLEGVRNSGEFARIDEISISDREGGSTTSGLISVGETEAETLDLSNYSITSVAGSGVSGSQMITTTGTGVASGEFTGSAGNYWLDIDWYDVADSARFTVEIDGVEVSSWLGSGGNSDGSVLTRRIAVDLTGGETIEITGESDGTELAGLDLLSISERDTGTLDAPTDAFDFFAFAGQSNAESMFFLREGNTTSGDLGYEVFEDAIFALTGVETTAIEAAWGGSASNNRAYAAKHWWNLDTDSPGQALIDAVDTIDDQIVDGRTLDGIFWAQGESDTTRVTEGRLTIAEAVDNLKTATIATFEYFRDIFGDVPIFIQELGEFEPAETIDAFRIAQSELVDDLDYVYFGASTAGAEHLDGLHFTNPAYGEIAEDLAIAAVDVIEDAFQIA